MADSDEDMDKDFGGTGLNMTGFLFGNIDENGELEDDILDSEAKQHLASLGRFGLGSFLNEMLTSEERDDNDDRSSNDNNAGDDSPDENYMEKSPSATDFSDIKELAEDIIQENGKNSLQLRNFRRN